MIKKIGIVLLGFLMLGLTSVANADDSLSLPLLQNSVETPHFNLRLDNRSQQNVALSYSADFSGSITMDLVNGTQLIHKTNSKVYNVFLHSADKEHSVLTVVFKGPRNSCEFTLKYAPAKLGGSSQHEVLISTPLFACPGAGHELIGDMVVLYITKMN